MVKKSLRNIAYYFQFSLLLLIHNCSKLLLEEEEDEEEVKNWKVFVVLLFLLPVVAAMGR